MTHVVSCNNDEFGDDVVEPGCEVCGALMNDKDVDNAMRAMSGWVCTSCLNKERPRKLYELQVRVIKR